jgi:hypothetical protein
VRRSGWRSGWRSGGGGRCVALQSIAASALLLVIPTMSLRPMCHTCPMLHAIMVLAGAWPLSATCRLHSLKNTRCLPSPPLPPSSSDAAFPPQAPHLHVQLLVWCEAPCGTHAQSYMLLGVPSATSPTTIPVPHAPYPQALHVLHAAHNPRPSTCCMPPAPHRPPPPPHLHIQLLRWCEAHMFEHCARLGSHQLPGHQVAVVLRHTQDDLWVCGCVGGGLVGWWGGVQGAGWGVRGVGESTSSSAGLSACLAGCGRVRRWLCPFAHNAAASIAVHSSLMLLP